jgi:hypothetical protein
MDWMYHGICLKLCNPNASAAVATEIADNSLLRVIPIKMAEFLRLEGTKMTTRQIFLTKVPHKFFTICMIYDFDFSNPSGVSTLLTTIDAHQ